MRFKVIRTSDDLPEDHWIARQLPAGTSLRPYAEDHAASQIAREIDVAMACSGQNRAALARRLGVSKSQVSQWLNGEANLTLKTLAAILWACGLEIDGLKTAPVGGRVTDAFVEGGGFSGNRPTLSVQHNASETK